MRADIQVLDNGDLQLFRSWEDVGFLTADNTAILTVLKKVNTSGKVVRQYYITPYTTGADLSNTFNLDEDGWYNLAVYTIPLIPGDDEFVSYQISNNKFIDPKTGDDISIDNFIKYIIPNLQNKVGYSKDTFQVFNLMHCYINYCNMLLEGECSKESLCPDSCDNEAAKNRDLIWVLLNTFNYMLKFGMFADAQKLMERISGCNGICTKGMFDKTYNCGCKK